MTQAGTGQLVAVVNTSEDVVRMLELVLKHHDYRTVTTYVADLRRGKPSIDEFLTENDPQVLLWDIAIPYEDNWRFFQSVAGSEAARGRRFVLMTVNKRGLESLVGPTDAHEIVGKPFDLDDLLEAVKRAFEER